MHAQIPQHALDRVVAQVAIAAVELQATVDHVEAGVGGKPLGHGGAPRRVGVAAVERRSRAIEHQPCGFEGGRIIGDPETERLKIGEARPELLALLHIADSAVEAELRAPERAGRDVEPSAVETAHGDLEPLPFGAHPIGHRHAAVLEHHHGGRLRVPAELLLLGAEREPRRALLDKQA